MNAVSSILSIMTSVLTWFVDSLETVTTIFYSSEGLTFIGGITVLGFAIGLVTMVIAMVRSLLKSRG